MKNNPSAETIVALSDNCNFPLCKSRAYRDGYCIGHAKHFAGPKKKKLPIGINKVSEKRKVEQRIYSKIVKAKIEESEGLCVLNGPTCSGMAEGGDHTQNRSPSNYIDPDNIEPACNNCNTLKVKFPKLFPNNVKSRFAK